VLVRVTSLDRTFAALADPTRRAILRRLAAGDATLSELAEPFPVSIQAVSKHLKVLEEAGLVSRGRRARLRPAHLEGASLKEAAEWIGRYRPFWERRFERIDRRLAAAKDRRA
jgi:DNA-binding transcriptional ArsR family regulator